MLRGAGDGVRLFLEEEKEVAEPGVLSDIAGARAASQRGFADAIERHDGASATRSLPVAFALKIQGNILSACERSVRAVEVANRQNLAHR